MNKQTQRHRIEKLEEELHDAWEGEGNKIPFGKWLNNMAMNEHGVLQNAAKELLALREQVKYVKVVVVFNLPLFPGYHDDADIVTSIRDAFEDFEKHVPLSIRHQPPALKNGETMRSGNWYCGDATAKITWGIDGEKVVRRYKDEKAQTLYDCLRQLGNPEAVKLANIPRAVSAAFSLGYEGKPRPEKAARASFVWVAYYAGRDSRGHT